MASWVYCGKEKTRIEGPLEHGLPPAAKNVKEDTKKRNAMIIKMGLKEAIDEGYIPIEKAAQAQRSINLYHGLGNSKIIGKLRHEWHYGKTGVGKSRPIREKFKDKPHKLYLKGCNIWWDHYSRQKNVIIEDLGPKMIGA